MSQTSSFEPDPPRAKLAEGEYTDALLLNLDGYEGPIDVLLDLARTQKVDLTKISIVQLVRQYLDFIERARVLNLQLAAEYLVMASWLTYLKSRLLLPRDTEDETPHSAEDMAEALQFQLRRLEAMRRVAGLLMARPKLGQDVFARGCPEDIGVRTTTTRHVTLYDLLKAYGRIQKRRDTSGYDLPVLDTMSMEKALSRLTRMLGALPRKGMYSVWTTLKSFMPAREDIKTPLYERSVLASTLTASLELAKRGELEIKQDGLFRAIYMRLKGAQ